MQDFKVDILGSEWSVKFGNKKEYPNLTSVDGYTDSSTREIVVDDMEASQGQIGSKADLKSYQKQVEMCIRDRGRTGKRYSPD